MRTRERPTTARARLPGQPSSSPLDEFEQLYLRNVDVLMGYFARRCREPQTVADLTSETFVRAVDGFAGFDPRRGSARAWLFGIAIRVFARHCEQSAVAREHGAALATADRPQPDRPRRRRPRVLAGGTLGLAGVGAVLVLVLGGSSAAPAFAVTTQADGSVQVQLNDATNQNLPQVEDKLAAMGTHEKVLIQMARGAATVSGPVQCQADPAGTSLSGPPVSVLVGTDGTEVIGAGQSVGNTAQGTFHLVACYVASDSYIAAGNSGLPTGSHSLP